MLSINFNFPDTSAYTPPRRSYRRDFEDFPPPPNFVKDEEDFPPPPHFLELTEPPETSFLFSDGNGPESLSPLRNKPPNISPLPSNQLLTILQDQSHK